MILKIILTLMATMIAGAILPPEAHASSSGGLGEAIFKFISRIIFNGDKFSFITLTISMLISWLILYIFSAKIRPWLDRQLTKPDPPADLQMLGQFFGLIKWVCTLGGLGLTVLVASILKGS